MLDGLQFLNKHKMTPLRQFIKNILMTVTANRFGQDMLEEIAQISHVLQGVGAGSIGASEVNTSGEKAIFRELKKRARGPYVIFDVGSNVGQFLQLTLESMEADELTVHCFEPSARAFNSLEASYSHDGRVSLNNFALGRDNGKGLLYYDAAGSGCASLTRRDMRHLGIKFDESETVRVVRLDDYCSTKGIDHIHVLKMDVEGHELDVLSGAREMFDAGAVDLATFEFGGCDIDTRTFFQDFWYFFREAGMNIFRITPTGYIYPIESYNDIHEKFSVTNFMAVAERLACKGASHSTRPEEPADRFVYPDKGKGILCKLSIRRKR